MNNQEIRTWVSRLIQSFGEPRKIVDPAPLQALHTEQRYCEMVGMVAKQLRLELTVRVGLVNSGGPDAPAWVECGGLQGIYGSPAFKASTITLYLQRAFLGRAPFAPVVMGIAHELSHVVLNSTLHPLREEEKVVDLTAMLLGYRGLWHNIHSDVTTGSTGVARHFAGTMVRSYGYLSTEEIRYAKALMRI